MKGFIVYLTFDGNCREAMEFYKGCLGAELHTMPFSSVPCDMPPEAKAQPDRVMHAQITKGKGILMASDIMPGHPYHPGNAITVNMSCDSLEEIEHSFAALSEGGNVTMPLADAFWGARFGMLKDKFGIPWMFNYEYPKEA